MKHKAAFVLWLMMVCAVVLLAVGQAPAAPPARQAQDTAPAAWTGEDPMDYLVILPISPGQVFEAQTLPLPATHEAHTLGMP